MDVLLIIMGSVYNDSQVRRPYLQLNAGLDLTRRRDQAAAAQSTSGSGSDRPLMAYRNAHVLRYLLNDLIIKEVCSFMFYDTRKET